MNLCVCIHITIIIFRIFTSPPIGGGRGIVMPMSVCLFVCLFVCPCFRKNSKCNISAISQPIIMKLGIHITYGYTVTDKYFQNFRSKVKVVGRRKVKNVIWPYLGNVEIRDWCQNVGECPNPPGGAAGEVCHL